VSAMSFNDPLHLGTPGLMPGDNPASYECSRCHDGFYDALPDRINGKLVCSVCHDKALCKCGVAFMLKDFDCCAICLERWYADPKNHAEFRENDSIGLFTGDAKQVGDKVRNAINAEMPSARKLLMDLHRTEQDRGNAAAAWDLIQCARWLEANEQRAQKVAR
jgi:hypothetical protein